MWPFLQTDVIAARTPSADDVAWASHLYPAEPALSATFGRISGRVTNGANDLPILGGHVHAVDPATQASVVGSVTADDGTYVLPGLPPGPWLVAIEPLDGDPPGLDPFRVNDVIAGTLDTAFPDEFRNAAEGAVEADPTAFEVITVAAGATAGGRDFVTNTLTLPGASARLAPGFNLFAWPVGVPAGTTAFDLLAALGGPDEVTAVERYVPRTGAFERAEHVDGAAAGVDFPLRSGEGFVVHMKNERLAGFTGGADCPAIDLAPGLNLIGVPCRPPGYTAFALLQDLGTALDVERVVRWDAAAQVYRTARYGTGGVAEGDDFPIDRGEGYMAIMRTAQGGVRLPRAGREVTPEIAGLSPGRGVPGTVVAILGEGFDADATKNLVRFNGVPAAVIVASTTTVTAAVPAAATTGPVTVMVGGRESNGVEFVVEPAVVQVPPGGTVELVSGQQAEAHLGADGEQDRYTFTALAGSVVTITAQALAAGVPDLVLALEDPFGVLVASDDNGNGGTDPRINNFVLHATGTHTIVVTNVPGSGTGGYRVRLAIATQPAPTQLSVLGGDDQNGEQGAPLDEPFTVFATGPTGAPLAGIPVTVVATELDAAPAASLGIVEALSVVVATNASGIVSISAVLPNKSGTFDVQLSIPGANPVSFKVAAVSTKIAAVTMRGDQQHGRVGQPLANRLEVVLLGPTSAPVPNALVKFQVIAGGGTISPATPQTSNAAGTAGVTFTLGHQTSARQIVAAFVRGRSKPLLFEAIPEPGAPQKVESNKSTFHRLTVGATILNATFVRVLDQFGNPVPNLEVTYQKPDGITVAPGVGPDGAVFPDFRTNADGLHVAALGVPTHFVGTGEFAADVTPTINELGARTGSNHFTVTAHVAGTSLTQAFAVDVDMGPRLLADGLMSVAGPMGTALGTPVAMRLVRIQRVPRGDGDFRNDDFARLLSTGVNNAVVHLDVRRRDGLDETSVGLNATRAPFTDTVTDANGGVSFPLTLGDVSGLVDVIGRINKVLVTFPSGGNQTVQFDDPSSLSQATLVRVQGPRVVVDLTDSGSGVDLSSVVAKLNGKAFFDGANPPLVLPFFPDRLEMIVGGRPLTTLGEDLVTRGGFDRVLMHWFPSRPELQATNVVEAGPHRDQAGNKDDSTATFNFPWPPSP
jgi:hypothetical protein